MTSDVGAAPVSVPHYANLTIASDSSVPPHERGRAIYNYRCYFCHGYSGDAQTLAATYLDPAPRNFQKTDPEKLSRQDMLEAVRFGKPDTAMKSFADMLSPTEIELVVDFIRQEFILDKKANTRYHTKENGWEDHERYAPAFPFATGEIPIDTPADQLDAEQKQGLRLFMKTCVTCHDRGKVRDDSDVWKPRPVSFPRNGYSHKEPRPDAVSSASIYGKHDISPPIEGMTAQEKQGERLFIDNCAFCHGADGSGQNWIGSFLEPRPRDLRSPQEMAGMTREELKRSIRLGVEGTKMPAWESVLTEAQIDALIAYIGRAFYSLN